MRLDCRISIGVLCFIVFVIGIKAQNLVPNPGFEEYTECPEFHSLIERAVPWKRCNYGSPDYFNRCATTPKYTIPFVGTLAGSYQEPRNGDGMCGMYNYEPRDETGTGEYICTPLLEKLKKGDNYYLEFYVAIDYSDVDPNTFTDAIGMAFMEEDIIGPLKEFNPLLLEPALYNGNGLLIEDDRWYRVSGCYEAKGNESFVVIGVFTPYDEINVLKESIFFSQDFNYKFIDDVGVYAYNPLDDVTELCDDREIKIGESYKDSRYRWSTGDTTAFITVSDPGNYSVELTRGECIFTDETLVIRNCEGNVYVPNIWSPNRDGINDIIQLGIDQEDLIENIYFVLIDRYGNIVADVRNEVSIETPEELMESVYTYFLTYHFIKSGTLIPKQKTGSITLMR